MGKLNRIFILLTAFMLVILTACGRGNRHEGGEYQNGNGIINDYVYSVSNLPLQTLTVSAPFHMQAIMREAGERLQSELAQAGISFRLDLNLFSSEEAEEAIIAQQTRLAAGVGDDVFVITPYHNLHGMISNGLLMDINHLINNFANQDDFITQALTALEVDGRLYTFPLAVPVTYVGINANLPQSVLNQFSNHNYTSVLKMVRIYNYLQDNYPEWNHLSPALNFAQLTRHSAQEIIDGYIYWGDGGVVTFPQSADAPLIQHLNAIRQPALDNTRHETLWEINHANPINASTMQLLSERYVFTSCVRPLDAVYALMDFESPFFINYMPLVNLDGGLSMFDISHHLIGVGAQADESLAWAFIKELATIHPGSNVGEVGFNLPIVKRLLGQYTEIAIQQALEASNLQPLLRQDAIDAQIASAISKHEQLLLMPFSSPSITQLIPFDVYREVVNGFLMQELSAELTNSLMQERITAWLEDAIVLELDFEALAALIDRDGLPVQELNILAFYEYYNALRQAEAALNQAWALRDAPYNFQLNITPYYWGDREMHQTRLQTALMAGQGYDIFTLGFQPIWSWAESGLLTDVWQLIDSSPATQRADFYENILEAFELRGGLYAFPLSFGFEYVGINAGLPESVINRFAQYDTITVVELMRIYTDMLHRYGDAYSHLRFSPTFHLSHPVEMMVSAIAAFIDFENRSATLTDSRFIEFLELLPQTVPGVGAFDGVVTTSYSHVSRGMYEQLSVNNAFVMESWYLKPAVAFLDVYDPLFINFIPLSDERGRLQMRLMQSGIWTTLLFPTAGNGTLAWEFTQHLIYAMSHPRLMGQYFNHATDGSMMQGNWGAASMSTPIVRAYFESHLTQAIERLLRVEFEFENSRIGLYGIFDDSESWFESTSRIPEIASDIVDDIMPRIAVYNASPATIPPFLPESLYDILVDILDLYLREIISASETAQRMQNAVTLWLMEQN